MPSVRVLTVRQRWAEWIALGEKDVENRTCPTPYRGPIAILAGKRWDPAGPALAERPVTGAVIAVTTIEDRVRGYRSRWAARGQWHWLLGDTYRLRQPIPVPGLSGLCGPRPI
jgi:hypothetical protein